MPSQRERLTPTMARTTRTPSASRDMTHVPLVMPNMFMSAKPSHDNHSCAAFSVTQSAARRRGKSARTRLCADEEQRILQEGHENLVVPARRLRHEVEHVDQQQREQHNQQNQPGVGAVARKALCAHLHAARLSADAATASSLCPTRTGDRPGRHSAHSTFPRIPVPRLVMRSSAQHEMAVTSPRALAFAEQSAPSRHRPGGQT
jgi:hypothetical protein